MKKSELRQMIHETVKEELSLNKKLQEAAAPNTNTIFAIIKYWDNGLVILDNIFTDKAIAQYRFTITIDADKARARVEKTELVQFDNLFVSELTAILTDTKNALATVKHTVLDKYSK